MAAMGTNLLLVACALVLVNGQNYGGQGTILRAGQNGQPRGDPYYDEGPRRPPPPPQYSPNGYNGNSNYNNRQNYNGYPATRQQGSGSQYNYNPNNAPGAHTNTYDATPRSYGVTPFHAPPANNHQQQNPTQTPTTTTTTSPKIIHRHNHEKDEDIPDIDENSVNQEALELTDSSSNNDTDDYVDIEPSHIHAHAHAHAHENEKGHYGAFHASSITTILVSYWTTDNPEELFFSCLGIAALAVFYEGMAALKDWLLVKFTNNYQSKASCRKTFHYCGLHLAKSIVYMIQLTSAYLLMLIAMTYNIFLFVAVILGSGIGHVLFSVISYRSKASANM